ncbi:MAG: hypothetical protein M0004_14670 [Actinomycetota bacterium]|nr:hypothetical protein [Actinomycetota bacterium]
MLIIALHRSYERTCRSCGYTWTVTRRQAQLHVTRSRAAARVRGSQNYYVENAIEAAAADETAQVERAEQFRRCARCGLDDFEQRRLRRRA